MTLLTPKYVQISLKNYNSSKRPLNYIILYRKRGNYIENFRLAIDEMDIFIDVIKDLEIHLKVIIKISRFLSFRSASTSFLFL